MATTSTEPLAAICGMLGMTTCMSFATIGSAYGMTKSGIAVCSVGINHPNKIMKSLIPVIMAGMIGIYGLLIGIILVTTKIKRSPEYTLYQGLGALAGGLACGLSGLASGIAIGIVGDAGIRANALNERVFTPMIVILVFAEALGIFGLILGIISSAK